MGLNTSKDINNFKKYELLSMDSKIRELFNQRYNKKNWDRCSFSQQFVHDYSEFGLSQSKYYDIWIEEIKEVLESYYGNAPVYNQKRRCKRLFLEIVWNLECLKDDNIINFCKYIESKYNVKMRTHNFEIMINNESTDDTYVENGNSICSLLNLFLYRAYVKHQENLISIKQIINIIEKLWGDNNVIFNYVEHKSRRNALYYASKYNNLELINYLIKKDCDTSLVDFDCCNFKDYLSPEIIKELDKSQENKDNHLPEYSEIPVC